MTFTVRALGVSLVALLATGCNGIATSPGMGPSALPVEPFVPHVPTPNPTPPPGPHFALEIAGMPTATDVEPWVGLVTVAADIRIIRPELPVRVVTTCGTLVQTHDLGSGSAPVRCLLPVGVHTIGAVAEMVDGTRYPTAHTVTVRRPVEQPLTIYFDLVDSVAGVGNTITFSVRTVDRAARYHWDFGDGGTDTSRLSSVEHRYTPTGSSYNERVVRVRAADVEGVTLTTGVVVGRW